ncbi:MAG: hypothetical protein IT287_02115 [Bdellovibrionaceae bacterium]|nr:hypothetical protein [Pseudobdellovibrionaceae bacterium]
MAKVWGFSRYVFIFSVLQIALLSHSFAATTPAVAPAETTKVTSESLQTTSAAVKAKEKDQQKSTTANKSVAQGLSIAESMMLNQSPWGISFSADAERGLVDVVDTWTSVNALNVSYRINKKSAVSVNLGYETLLQKYDGAVLNNADVYPGRYGLTDLSISYTRPTIWSDKYNRLVWTSNISLPTSRASQRNSLIADVSTGLALRYQPFQGLIITPSAGVYYRQYTYETANVFGTQPNSPAGYRYGLSTSYVFNSWFIGALNYSQTRRYDFFSDWRTIQSGTAALIINATDVLNVSVGYNWRDRIISNEPLFDRNKSIFFIGVGYVF